MRPGALWASSCALTRNSRKATSLPVPLGPGTPPLLCLRGVPPVHLPGAEDETVSPRPFSQVASRPLTPQDS